jgi:RimJ/RimL family protein N-acetyltransferase
VSYFIGERSCWGKGLATAAIRAACGIAFERLDLHRLQAGLYAGNVGSLRALEKAGFTREGVWRQQLLGPDGWEDHVFLGMLRQEWTP